MEVALTLAYVKTVKEGAGVWFFFFFLFFKNYSRIHPEKRTLTSIYSQEDDKGRGTVC